MTTAVASSVTCTLPGCFLPSAYFVPVNGQLERRCLYDSGFFAWCELCDRCGITSSGHDCGWCGGLGFFFTTPQTPAGQAPPPRPARQDSTPRYGGVTPTASAAVPGTQGVDLSESTEPVRESDPRSARDQPESRPTRRPHSHRRGAHRMAGSHSPADPYVELLFWIVFFLIIAVVACWLADRR